MKYSHKMPDSPCPYCGAVHDGASDGFSRNPERPSPGDAGMCCDCGQWSFFDKHLQRRKPTPHEQLQLDGDYRVAMSNVAFKMWKAQQTKH